MVPVYTKNMNSSTALSETATSSSYLSFFSPLSLRTLSVSLSAYPSIPLFFANSAISFNFSTTISVCFGSQGPCANP